MAKISEQAAKIIRKYGIGNITTPSRTDKPLFQDESLSTIMKMKKDENWARRFLNISPNTPINELSIRLHRENTWKSITNNSRRLRHGLKEIEAKIEELTSQREIAKRELKESNIKLLELEKAISILEDKYVNSIYVARSLPTVEEDLIGMREPENKDEKSFALKRRVPMLTSVNLPEIPDTHQDISDLAEDDF